ncbi:MAG TPA: HAMP domain-containing histidine kinase [Candidatus Wolfebacteria bacterium]|nr:HAMP domain-containing histidine kinase [Candidatus Wolfebacteria bacterium]
MREEKKDFLRVAKHQLRTPLTLVKGYLSFMKSGDFQKFPADKQKEIINKMVIESEKLNNLINDVFLSLQIRKGLKITPEPIQLKEFIENIYNQSLKPNYKKKGLILNIQQDADSHGLDADSCEQKDTETPLVINSDKFYLTIVIQKLLDNAEKYSTSEQVIDINIRKENNYAIIEIKDSGIGITEEEKPKIFERFFRGIEAKKNWSNGSGLSIDITKGIIEILGGEFSIESEGQNQGTRSIVKLPLTL